MTFGERIVHFRKKLGLSQKELAEHIGITANCLYYYEKDKRQPTVELIREIANALSISGDELLGTKWAAASHPDIIHLIPQRVPLLGEIACGEPIFAQEDLSLMVDAPIECDFALRCKGDSMVDARILSGDLVFIRKQDVVDDGSIAAVLIDDEATLKRVYHLSDGRVELRAANVLYAPIIIGGEDETRTCRIIGKAVGFQSIFV